jgi:hypothetical protein
MRGCSFSLLLSTALGAFVAAGPARALTVDPVDDGSIYAVGSVVTIQYLLTGTSIRAVAEFPTVAITGPISSARLTVNPYGLGLGDLTLDVYAYSDGDGALSFADYNRGTFIGVWTLPSTLGYGEDAYFDVTPFLQGASGAFVGFNLRSEGPGPDIFSSLENNYGHPAQLWITFVPEPAAAVLLLGALAPVLRARYSQPRG